MSDWTQRPGSDLPRALRDAAVAALIAAGLFLPLIALQSVTNIRNEVVLETRWRLFFILVAIVFAGRLALTGGSDGGLMCGVAVTTRPDLWRAVLPREPLLDLIGGTRDPYLDFVIRKAWADPDDPAEVRRLLRERGLLDPPRADAEIEPHSPDPPV